MLIEGGHRVATAVKKSGSVTKQIEKFRHLLEEVGFKADSPTADSFTFVGQETPDQSQSPWKVTTWSMTQGHGSWSTEHLNLSIQLDYLSQRLSEELNARFGTNSSLELIPAIDQGIWVLLEVFGEKPSDADTEMVGTVGFRFDLTTEGSNLCLHFSRHFLIGAIPDAILSSVPEIFMQCFSFTELAAESETGLFESRIGFNGLLNQIVGGDLDLSKILDAATELGVEVEDGIKAHLRTSFDGLCWDLSASTLGEGMYEFDVPPIEIVESRELGSRYLELDQLILAGEPEEAKSICLESLSEEPDSLFLLRRLCLISLATNLAIDDQYLHTMMNIDSDNLLFLSAAAHTSILTNRGSHLLKFLSKMGQLLNTQLTNFEDLKTMDVVLPELLGDGWSEVNVQTAQACYQRVLAKRGDVPRILWKMVQIARKTDDRPAEIALLERLVEVESSKPKAAGCYMRLADLQQIEDADAAAESSLKGWKLDPVNTDFAEIASYNLVQVKDYEKAVRVLDDCRKLIEPQTNQVKKVDLELLIARIWFTFLKRKDLAKIRIEYAIQAIPDDIDNLKRCEDISEEFAETSLLVTIRESLLSLSLKRRDRAETFRVKEGLQKHYVDADSSGQNYARISEKVLGVFLIDTDEIQTLLDLGSAIKVDWAGLVANLEFHLSATKVNSLQQYLILIGQICNVKLEDKEKAAQAFESALKVGSVDNYIYDFLNEYYAAVKQLDRRDFVLKHQLQNAPDDERVSILKELFYTSADSSDHELDSYAIKILKEGSEDAPVKKRFITYQERQEIEEIDHFLAEICAEIFDRIDQFNWMKHALDCLNECDAKEKYDLIEKILKDIKPYYKDIFEWYEAGVSYHKADKSHRFLEPYLNKLILNGIPPDVDKRITLQVLKSNPIAKGLFYRYLANQEEQTKEIAACLRQALAYLTDQAGYEATAEGIISQLADIVILTKDEMAYYQRLTKASDNHDDFYRIVDAQLRGLNKKDQFDGIKELGLSIIQDNPTKVIGFAKSMLKCVESFDPRSIEAFRFDLLEINKAYRQFLPEVWGIKYLRNLAHWSDGARYRLVLDWILDGSKNRDAVASIFKENMIKLRTKRDFESLDRFAVLAKGYGFSFNTYNWFLFQNFYNKKSQEKAHYYWVEFVKTMPDISGWRKFYRDTCDLMKDNPEEITELLHLAHRDLATVLDQAILDELGIELGISLFHQDRETELAHKLIHDRFNRDSTDKRCWLPLYFLNSILKKKENQYQLLYQIIPNLEAAPELIGDYPTSIESMHKEFGRVARQLKKSDQIEGYTFGAPQPPAEAAQTGDRSAAGTPVSEFAAEAKANEGSIGFQVDSQPMDLGSLFASSDEIQSDQPKKPSPIPLSVRNIAFKQGTSDSEELPAAPSHMVAKVPKVTKKTADESLTSLLQKPASQPPPRQVEGDTSKPQRSLNRSVKKEEPAPPPKEPQSFLKRSRERWLGGKPERPKDSFEGASDKGLPASVAGSVPATPKPEASQAEASPPNQPPPLGGAAVAASPSPSNDWRDWLRSDETPVFEKIGELAFPNRAAKYVALQAATLKEGADASRLKNFNWLDFVEPWNGELGKLKHPLLTTDLYRVIQGSQDFLAELYQEKYSLRTISRVFGLTIDRFLASRASIQFTELFSWPWAESYQKILDAKGVNIVFIEGPQKVLFEARKAKLYVSQSLAISPNPDLLFHILYILRAMDLGLFEFLMLKERVKDPLIEYLQKTEIEGVDQSTKDDVIVQLQKPDELSRIVGCIREQIVAILLHESRNLIDLADFEVKQEPGKSDLSAAELKAFIELAIQLSDELA